MTYWDTVIDEKDIFGLPGMTWEEGIERSMEEVAPAFRNGYTVSGWPVLDLGCGPGRLAVPLGEKYRRLIVGVDSSRAMIDLAEATPWVSYILCDGDTLPPSIGKLSGAYSMLLFQHLGPKQVASYIRQVGGQLDIECPFRFQFVPGEHHEERSHAYTIEQMAAWCMEARLMLAESEPSEMYPGWQWFTAVRR